MKQRYNTFAERAGPNNRVIFVELPQSIYVTRKFKPYPDVAAFWGNYLVQTWWRLSGVVTADVAEQAGTALEGCKDETTEGGSSDVQPVRPPDLRELKQLAEIQQSQQKSLMQFFHLHETPYENVKSLTRSSRAHLCTWAQNWQFNVYDVNHAMPNDPDQAAYTLDLIPRQSALNVAEAQSTSRAYGFAGLIGLISGFGAKARYEQQRDTYNQFAQQEAYASAFGKGQDTFGWTFGPLPGTKRMAPGLRTTYAVLVVPRTARVVRMEGIGCGYRRRRVPQDPFQYDDGQNSDEDCGKKVSYDLEIPTGDDSFFLEGVFYKPAPAGQRMSLELQGTFGAQIGILINGTPLQKVVSLGQPLLEQTAFNIPGNAGESGIQGVYELVGRTTILMSFVMPASFSGTPRISVISPGHAAVVNSYRIEVHDGAGTRTHTRKLDDAAPMFSLPLTISRVTPIYDHSTK
jgi:hypothetical protein